MKYKVCLIGAGSIGALKDDNIDYPGSPDILTHANAINVHQEAELYAVVDPDIEKLKKVKSKWQPKNLFNSIEQMYGILQGDEPDIVIVATPTDTHYQILNDILKYSSNKSSGNPKLVIAEKPFCSNTKEAQTIIQEYESRNIPICIDYIRRFSKGHQDIKKIIDSEKFGKVQNVRVLYTRGWHDCCHAIDLMEYFFGEYRNCKQIWGMPIFDRNLEDPTVNYQFIYGKCDNIIFQGCDGRKFGIFEIDIILDEARIRLIENGLFYEIYPITENNKWGHKDLNYSLTSVIRQETGLNISLYNLLDNVIQNLSNDVKLLCTAQDALKIHKIYNQLGV